MTVPPSYAAPPVTVHRELSEAAGQSSISIIIPTFNEARDIAQTLRAASRNGPALKEILVVDDSNDDTPDVVARHPDRRVRLIRRAKPLDGCCGARNVGMMEATGDIVVLLNADVRVPPDFADRLLIHYSSGADYVLIESRVENDQTLFPRFLQCEHEYLYGDKSNLLWTEGFSCRRVAAATIGFIPGKYPEPFCRDWLFGRRLFEAGYRGILDRTLVVRHRAPEGVRETFQTRKARGHIAALFRYYAYGQSAFVVSARSLARTAYCLGRVVLVLPLLWRARKLTKCSPRGTRDWPAFVMADAMTTGAFCVGELLTSIRLARAELAGGLNVWRCSSRGARR